MSEVALREDLNPQNKVIEAVRQPAFREQLEAALPANVSVDRFVRVTVTALRENADLVKADPNSLLSAVVKCAQDGLLPDGREAALTHFSNKKKGIIEAVYMPMIGGFRKIAAEFGWSIHTAAIYARDEFDYAVVDGEERLNHRPARLLSDRGDLIGAYAIGRHQDGRKRFEVMPKEEIDKVRQVSRAKNAGPWVDWTERMYEKTAGRRLFAKLPLGDRDRVERVLQADGLAPEQAAAALYGPGGETYQAREIEAAPHPVAASNDGPEPGGSGAVSGPEAADAEPAAASGPPPEPEPDFDPVALAGEVRFEEPSKVAGMTIAEVAALGEDGAKYVVWASRDFNDERVKAAATTYAAHHLKDYL